jgi:hypothetical protein
VGFDPPYTGANWKLVSVDFLRASFTAQVAYAQLGALMGVALCSVAPPHLHVASAIGCDRDVAEGDAEAYGTTACPASWCATVLKCQICPLVLTPVEQKEARAKAVKAVAYASSYHSEWLWKGVGSGR